MQRSLLLQSPLCLPSLPPPCLVLAAELGLLRCVSKGHDETPHFVDMMKHYTLPRHFRYTCALVFSPPAHPAALTRDNHSCAFEHHILR